MKLTLFALLAAFFATGCTKTLYNHRADYTPVDRQGTWNDHYKAVKKGEEPQYPKQEEKK